MTNKIGFPNLGLDPFDINRVAFSIGSVTVYWYGILICLGMVLGFSYLYYRVKKCGMTLDNVADIAICVIPSAIIGARLYYVLTTLGDYDSFLEMIAIWNGGIAIYGGVIAGALALYGLCRWKKFPTLKVFDAAAPSVMIGQIIGRWGNFMNGEAYGVIGKYDYLGMEITTTGQNNPFIMSLNGQLVHPTFLYESVWNLLGFVLINIFYNKKKFDGEVLLWYLSWYGIGRSVIEGFRGDSLYVGSIRISQLVGVLCFVVGVSVIVWKRVKLMKAKKATDVEKVEKSVE